jgi:hypothetical protein
MQRRRTCHDTRRWLISFSLDAQMTFVVAVTLLMLAGIIILRLQSIDWNTGFLIIVLSICVFVLGYELVGGGLARIPNLDHYLVIHGFTDTWREEAIYFVPGALLGALCFTWMLRRHLTKRSSERRTRRTLDF